ncbi:ferritin family protein [candidate division KSB1 bacterium]|nr:ferritin family protein [candidate division KSB1 bacterium]
MGMKISYSGHEVIEMGIQIEQKGVDFYSLLSKRAKQPQLVDLFSWLAEQEKQHIIVFEELRKSFEKSLINSPYNWDEVSGYFQALIDTKVFPDTDDGYMLSDELNDEIGAIQIAISFEKDNILFFQEIRELADNGNRDIINNLIIQEKSHIMKLLEIKRNIIG